MVSGLCRIPTRGIVGYMQSSRKHRKLGSEQVGQVKVEQPVPDDDRIQEGYVELPQAQYRHWEDSRSWDRRDLPNTLLVMSTEGYK